jgi:hypothetical protein
MMPIKTWIAAGLFSAGVALTSAGGGNAAALGLPQLDRAVTNEIASPLVEVGHRRHWRQRNHWRGYHEWGYRKHRRNHYVRRRCHYDSYYCGSHYSYRYRRPHHYSYGFSYGY